MVGEDAQRELEQRALRNVRGLVDRMEDDEKLSRRKQVRVVAWLVGLVLVALVAVLVAGSRRAAEHAPLDLKSIKAPEARPQGSRSP